MSRQENTPTQPHNPEQPQEENVANASPKPELVVNNESKIPETSDPRYDLIAEQAQTTFPELADMDPADKVRLLFGEVGWRILDPKDEIPEAKKQAITDWSANALIDVLPQGVLRDEKKLADKIAGAHPVLREERRGIVDEARTDAQTGLGNARAFDEFKAALNNDPERLKGKGVCYVDLNGLKDANTVFGTLVGDYLIKLSAESMRNGANQLFADVERKKGKGAQIFRISEGADDYVAILPLDHVDEFAQYIAQTFGHLNGDEKDHQELDSKGAPQVLTPPEGISVSSGTEVNGRKIVGYVSISGAHRETGVHASINSSLSVGVIKPENVETLTVEDMVKKAFNKMDEDKNFIKDTFPNLASR